MSSFVPGSKVAVRGIFIMGINFYYVVDDHPLPYGNNGSLDPGTFEEDVDIWWRPQWWQTQLDGFKIRT